MEVLIKKKMCSSCKDAIETVFTRCKSVYGFTEGIVEFCPSVCLCCSFFFTFSSRSMLRFHCPFVDSLRAPMFSLPLNICHLFLESGSLFLSRSPVLFNRLTLIFIISDFRRHFRRLYTFKFTFLSVLVMFCLSVFNNVLY